MPGTIQEKPFVSSVCNQGVPFEGKPLARPVSNRDTLHVQQEVINFNCPSFIKEIWEKIVSFFSSCFTPTSTSTSSVSAAQIAEIKRIANEKGFIWFWKAPENKLTACFGNFDPCTVKLWGREFPCAEAAFQAGKFKGDPSKMDQFTTSQLKPNSASLGDAAWRLGATLSQTWTKDEVEAWRGRSRDVMNEVLQAKFSQNSGHKEALLATGTSHLVEHTKFDAHWGDNGDGTGRNWLGEGLMKLRKKLGGSGAPHQVPKAYWKFITEQTGKSS